MFKVLGLVFGGLGFRVWCFGQGLGYTGTFLPTDATKPKQCLEGQGDLVSRLIIGISGLLYGL